jgi:uncharacterized membrane-anchored protein
MFEKNLCTILELKTAVKLEIEALSTETVAKFWNIFFLSLHTVGHLWRHRMEHVLL